MPGCFILYKKTNPTRKSEWGLVKVNDNLQNHAGTAVLGSAG